MTEPTASPVHLRDVGLTFPGGVEALRGVELDVEAGSLTTIVGPSGCGKSTLLRLVAGLLLPTGGAIEAGVRDQRYSGKTVARLRAMQAKEERKAAPDQESLREMELAIRAKTGWRALMFQEPRLLPWRKIWRQVALPLELLGRPVERAAIDAALADVGLAGFADALPHQLSGGMQMRVALARALVTRPQLLLLDEPFGALDEITRETMGEQLVALQREGGFTALLVTHSVYEAVFLSHRVVVMSSRPGRIVGGVDVPFEERPHALRTDPAFARLCREVSELLRAGMEEAA